MLNFDLDYANERIDCIKQTYKNMLDLYEQIKYINPSNDTMNNLDELYTSINVDISNYYKYLEKTGVPIEDSYLTSWLDINACYYYFENIEYFLQN